VNGQNENNSEGVASVRQRIGCNAFSVDEFGERFPRVVAPRLPARTANPGLMDLNPVGIRGENHHLDNPRRNK